MQLRSLIALLLTLAFAASSQDVPIRVNTTLVLVPVTVTDPNNRYVLGLDKDDFKVLEDGTEQKIKQFSGEDAPLSVGFLVDTSGSIGNKMDLCREAVKQFLKTMDTQDEAFLVAFSDRAELLAPLTHDNTEIMNKLSTAKLGGMTALFDGIFIGLDEMKKAHNPRKALVVISDGGDNNSAFSAKETLDRAMEAGVQVYGMGVFEPYASFGLSGAELRGPRLLSNIAEQTGGRAFAASSLEELPGIASRIGIELRNQYLLAYTPINQAKDGKYRKLEVKVTQPKGLTGLVARWRLGYYAPTQ